MSAVPPVDTATERSPGQPPPPVGLATGFDIDALANEFPSLSARRRMSLPQRIGLGVAVVVVVSSFAAAPIVAGTIAMAALIALYSAVLALRIDLARRRNDHRRFSFTDEQLMAIDDAALPTFTILVPAFREPEVIAHVVAHLEALVYPRDRLDIKLVLEEGDDATIDAAMQLDLAAPFEVVVVARGGPQTKPKALNVALDTARGDYVCVYDAEDRPEPMQLRKVAATFAECGPEVACVQAELGFFNAGENVITRWFAIEYRMWFTQFLPALSSVDAPIPLGGTSNHIRRDLLVGLRAWDPYNVTEDADLGVRLRRQGFRVAVLDSTTLEEANTDFVNWIKQRSRWYKGYAQTWLVHMRHPRQLLREVGFGGFVRFNLFVGGTPLLAVLNPVSWLLLLLWFTLQPNFIQQIMPAPVYYAGLAGWLAGNFTFYYLNLLTAYEMRVERVFRAALALPVYWLMMAIAAIKALVQLIFNPNYWEKTTHGLTTRPDDLEPVVAADPAQTTPGGAAGEPSVNSAVGVR